MAETIVRITDSSLAPQASAGMRIREYHVTSSIWRRHSERCDQRSSGRKALRCTCPLWADGYIDSMRVLRRSLDTRNLTDAQTTLDALIGDYIRQMDPKSSTPETKTNVNEVEAPRVEVQQETPPPSAKEVLANDPRLICNASEAFLKNCVVDGIKAPTIRKYRNVLNKLGLFSERADVKKRMIAEFSITDLDSYRASRRIAPITSLKELEVLRQFWEHCVVRGWCEVNIAKQIKTPRIVEQNKVVPYTKEEVKAIIRACSEFGLYEYEKRRAKGMVLILRYTALRISDTALMRRDRISRDGNQWRIFLHTTKNNAPVYLPIPDELMEVLESLPAPRGSDANCPYFFWNGKSIPKSMISVAEETLSAVFRKSGVQDAGAHRFRHSLATELLGAGASFGEVADILGNSAAIVEKHYAKWSIKRQSRVDNLMKKVHKKAWNSKS
jgi:integrase